MTNDPATTAAREIMTLAVGFPSHDSITEGIEIIRRAYAERERAAQELEKIASDYLAHQRIDLMNHLDKMGDDGTCRLCERLSKNIDRIESALARWRELTAAEPQATPPENTVAD